MAHIRALSRHRETRISKGKRSKLVFAPRRPRRLSRAVFSARKAENDHKPIRGHSVYPMSGRLSRSCNGMVQDDVDLGTCSDVQSHKESIHAQVCAVLLAQGSEEEFTNRSRLAGRTKCPFVDVLHAETLTIIPELRLPGLPGRLRQVFGTL
jgi:hypothetical protein